MEGPSRRRLTRSNAASKVTGPWRYERLEGVGHFIPLEAADQLNRLLLDFLPRR